MKSDVDDSLEYINDFAFLLVKMHTFCIGETGVSWHVFQKNAHKTQENLMSGMSDVLVKR